MVVVTKVVMSVGSGQGDGQGLGVGLEAELVQGRRSREPEFVSGDPLVERADQRRKPQNERADHLCSEHIDGVPPALVGHQCAHRVEELRAGRRT